MPKKKPVTIYLTDAQRAGVENLASQTSEENSTTGVSLAKYFELLTNHAIGTNLVFRNVWHPLDDEDRRSLRVAEDSPGYATDPKPQKKSAAKK